MYERFLPLMKTTTLFVNRFRKCLYRMCEDFTRENTQQFLLHANNDVKDLPKYTTEDVYLEKYLLHLETEKYISCDKADANFKNIIKICKYMEMDNWQNELEKLFPPKTQQTKTEEIKPSSSSYDSPPMDSGDEQFDLEEFDKTPTIPSTSNLLKEKAKSRKPHLHIPDVTPNLGNENYDINPTNPGIVIIINNEYFYSAYEKNLIELLPSPQQLEQREGTQEDKKYLIETFKHFGFKIVCFDNLTHEKIISDLKKELASIKEESSIFVVILSHGIEGAVYGSNSIPLKVTEIKNVMCSPFLASKPKVLILQCCQGNDVQDLKENVDLTTDSPVKSLQTPKMADMLVFWATVPGYGAIRHKKLGTWFIQALCKTMKEKSMCHFIDICVLTQKEVTEKRWHQKVMVPLMETTFTKFLYLPNSDTK